MIRRSRMSVLGGLLLGGAFFVAGCGIESGTVTEKEYEEAYTSWVTTCTAYSAQGTCTTWVPIPYTTPECWELDLDNGRETGEVCVSKEAWDTYGVGDHYPRTETK